MRHSELMSASREQIDEATALRKSGTRKSVSRGGDEVVYLNTQGEVDEADWGVCLQLGSGDEI